MDDPGGSFVAVRRISQGFDRGNNSNSSFSSHFHLLLYWMMYSRLYCLMRGVNFSSS